MEKTYNFHILRIPSNYAHVLLRNICYAYETVSEEIKLTSYGRITEHYFALAATKLYTALSNCVSVFQ